MSALFVFEHELNELNELGTMIKEFVLAWDANKEKLRNYIASHDQEEYNEYSKIVRMIFEQVINPYYKGTEYSEFDLNKIHEIDDGDYQGTLMYLIPCETYQPSQWEYVITFVGYGSCSGCDTLLGINGYGGDEPTSEQVKEYMDLCLHILQHCKFPYNDQDEE